MIYKILCIGLMLIMNFVYSQTNAIEGKWIIENINYKNGNQLETNHELYSAEIKLLFTNHQMFYNGKKLNIDIDNKEIKGGGIYYKYKIFGDTLTIDDVNSDLKYTFLKEIEFLKKYPEFLQRIEHYQNEDYYVSNFVIEPRLLNKEVLEDKLSRFLKDKLWGKKTGFTLKFYINKFGELINVELAENNLKESLHKKVIDYVMSKNLKFSNSIGKNILLEKSFMFMFADFEKVLKEERIKLNVDLNKLYMENKFSEYIAFTEKLKKSNQYLQAENNKINLAISYLATNQYDKACNTFSEIGDITNFKIRNYLKNFCQKN